MELELRMLDPAVRADRAEVERLLHPEFREFGRLKIVASYGQLKGRMLSMLQETAEERYTSLVTNRPEIFQQVPLKYIASYLGITDSTLSRLRKSFVKK